jgi:TRAP-type C4-dicarboxylate transport system substrate-binding protein
MTEAVAKSSFQELIESVEALPLDDREILMEIINKRISEQRRDELEADMEESLEAYRKGEVRVGTVDDLLKDLKEDMRD